MGILAAAATSRPGLSLICGGGKMVQSSNQSPVAMKRLFLGVDVDGSGGYDSKSTIVLRHGNRKEIIARLAMVHDNKKMHRLSIPVAARTRSISIAAAATATATDSSNKDDDHVNVQDPPTENGIFTISSNISTELPLYEPPGVSLDEYINDRARVFRAMCPDRYRIQRLNDEEWRIQTLPIHFLFASVSLVIVMRLRCKSNGQEYPPAAPGGTAATILESQATRSELQGLKGIERPSHFSLRWHGTLSAERRGGNSHLKGHLEMSISLALPPGLHLVPKDVLKAVIESVLKRLLKNLKHEADNRLVSDFDKYWRKRLMKHGQDPQHPEIVAEQGGDS